MMTTSNEQAQWTPYTVEFKVGRRVRTWTRFAPTQEHAIESARQALKDEFFGDATLLSVMAQ
jgi:hypothetical protein